ncbi:hypothetical protein ANCDUO_25800 [Ancylostoma duodenale]|uniref:Uncharacterized protein n=1 Tax=Ancylostoma duodenale TaxID=51022 RepID=A0A0C2C3G1_9BILA|nr:hypothetical protein ANCDUO_25800 [Ancylostoma duodenale]
MVRLLHEVLQGKIQCSSCPSSGQNPLDDSGTREGQMEGLLTPARYIRRSTGVKVIKVIANVECDRVMAKSVESIAWADS